MKPNTYAFVTLELYPTTVGGVGILLYHTISALLRSENCIVLYLDCNEEEILQFSRIDRYVFPNPHLLTFYDVRGMSHSLDFCKDLYNPDQFRSVCIAHALLLTQKDHDIDLIEFFDYCGPAFHYLSYAPSERRPVAIRFHNTTEIIERGTRSLFDKHRINTYSMERTQLILADIVLSPGKAFLDEEILKLYHLELTRQVVEIAPPIHTSIGTIVYKPKSRRILFYGRLSTFKGLDTFINAAVIALRDESFCAWLQSFAIVGPEETVASALTLDEIKSVIPAEMADKFEFIGRVTHQQLLQILDGVAFACFANRMESFCYAAHELYTAGIPLIMSDRPAFRDHFAEDDVVFFDRSAGGLASEMVGLAANPDKRVALVARARAPARGEPDAGALYASLAKRAGARLAAKTASVPEATETPTLTVFILSNGDLEAEGITLSSLIDARTVAYVLRLSDDGQINYAGLRWSLRCATDMLGKVSTAYMFVRAGDVCFGDALLEAACLLTQDEQVGAIALWCDIEGRVRSAPQAFVPELGATMGPGLRTLIRSPWGSTVIELLRTGSFADETAALLAQRAEGRGIVEKPVVGVSIDKSVYLPPGISDPGVDYDRMTPMYLALSRGMRLSAGTGSRERISLPHSHFLNHDFISIRATDTFGEGELWVLRLFSQRGGMHESWSTVQQFGEWMLVREPQSPPGGALKTYNGELCFWANNRYGIEFLFGPFCSGVEICWRDVTYQLQLRQDLVSSTVVWLDDLARGLFQPPRNEKAPVQAVGQRTLSEGAKMWTRTNTGPATTRIALTQNKALVKPGPNPVVLPATLVGAELYTIGDLVFALLAAKGANDWVIQVPFDFPSGAAMAGLLLQSEQVAISVDIDERAPDQSPRELYRALASWIGIVGTRHQRLEFFGSDEDLLFSLRDIGATIRQLGYRLPACPAMRIRISNEVDIVILSSRGLIDNVAHMIAGAAFLSVHGIKVGTIFLEENQQQAAIVCETFAAARTYISYSALERVVTQARQRPLVACAIYPDPTIPLQGAKALALGIPTLFGPVGRSERFRAALGDMSVIFWEDSRDIGNALARLVFERDAIVRGYNDAVAKQT